MKKLILLIIVIMGLVSGILIIKNKRDKEEVQEASQLTQEETKIMETSLKITSPAFKDGEVIPEKYTCDGENISPPINISGVSDEAKSLVLIVDDPDAPSGTWNHFLAWNIDPKSTEISEGQIPQGAVLGKNDFDKLDYGGPCPPSGTHRYFFRLLALDRTLDLNQGAKRNELEKAMTGHVIAEASLMGKYSRNK